MNRQPRFSLLFLGISFPIDAHASDMGNGAMMLGTWLFGLAAVVLFSVLKSSERDANGALGKVDKAKFTKTVLLLLPLVFILGLIALANG